MTELGREQAIALMSRLQTIDPDALFSSPYRRAIDTIRTFAEAEDMKIRTYGELRERLLKPIGEVRPDWLEHVRKSFDDRDYRLRGGESLNQTCERAMLAMGWIVDAGYKRPVVAAHGNLIASVLGYLDADFGCSEWQGMKNPHIYRLHYENGSCSGFEDLG